MEAEPAQEPEKEEEVVPTKEVKIVTLSTDKLIPEADRNVIDVLIASKALPPYITNRAIAHTIIGFGRELGLKPQQAIQYITMIKGKMALSSMAIGALLRSNNIDYRLVQDGMYHYADGTTSFIPLPEELKKGKPLDRITEYIFYYKFAGEMVKQSVCYTFKEAEQASLSDKDNWKNYRRDMMRVRCLARGARIVAPQILMGMYADVELSDVTGSDDIEDVAYVDAD